MGITALPSRKSGRRRPYPPRIERGGLKETAGGRVGWWTRAFAPHLESPEAAAGWLAAQRAEKKGQRPLGFPELQQ